MPEYRYPVTAICMNGENWRLIKFIGLPNQDKNCNHCENEELLEYRSSSHQCFTTMATAALIHYNSCFIYTQLFHYINVALTQVGILLSQIRFNDIIPTLFSRGSLIFYPVTLQFTLVTLNYSLDSQTKPCELHNDLCCPLLRLVGSARMGQPHLSKQKQHAHSKHSGSHNSWPGLTTKWLSLLLT